MRKAFCYLVLTISALSFIAECEGSNGRSPSEDVVSSAMRSSADNWAKKLSNSIREASDKLSNSEKAGKEETAKTVRELSPSISEIAEQVSLKVNVDSGDLAGIGAEATKNLRDALVELSRNWNVSMNTADLKDVGATAAGHLSAALQNINARLELNFHFGINKHAENAVGYISMAVGFAFAVLFVGILVSLKQCRKCCGNKTCPVEGEEGIKQINGMEESFKLKIPEDEASGEDFVKSFERNNKRITLSLSGYKYEQVRNFWDGNKQPINTIRV